jgi:hypothetical protein
MNDAGTLPRHMLDIRELTAEAFAPYGQVIAPLRTGGQGAETRHDPEASRPARQSSSWVMASRGCGSCICRMSGSASPGSRATGG